MKNKGTEVSLVLVMGLSLFVLAIVTTPVGAQPPPLNATVSIGNISIPQGATRTIPIMIDEASDDVISADINLTYDSSVVQVTAVGGNPSWDSFYSNIVDGKVRMTAAQWGSPPLTAPTKFANITLKAIGNPGDYTPLNLECYDGKRGVYTVYMGSGSPYPEMTVNNGSVTIIGVIPVYNTFGMIALIGLLAIVLAVTVRRR